jgi:DNA (cytosine-5)-methyltransferase 1
MECETVAFVRDKRQRMGLNQRGFAEALGLGDVGERTVRAWENGEHKPTKSSLDRIQKLAEDAPYKPPVKHSFRFIDLFAGIGGIRLPFQELGGKCVFTSEWDKYSKVTYAANFGEVPEGDITEIYAGEIPNHEVLLAGFPCQAFSQAGLRNGFNDTRGTMFFEIQRILAEKRPAAFLLENVKQLKGHDKGKTLATILEILRGENSPVIPDDVPMSAAARRSISTRLDYNVDFRVLRATDFGVPQKRERVYIVGFSRKAFPNIDISTFFDGIEKVQEPTKLGDVLEPNVSLSSHYTISDKLYNGHKRRRIEHAEKGNGFGFSVFNSDSPYCNTISARYYKDGSEILIDQSDISKNPRKLTPRECARIQGFPEDFNVNSVSESQIYRQFGNSVSVPVIRAIAKRMVDLAGFDRTKEEVEQPLAVNNIPLLLREPSMC